MHPWVGLVISCDPCCKRCHPWKNSAGAAQIPCAQLRFDRQRAHRGEGTAMVTESGDSDRGAKKSGFWSHSFEKFVQKLPTLTGLREDLQATMLFMLVLDSFLVFHRNH